ncbi:endonuclease [Putridiphycobacter roseus]|uniref:Endonuclease n=1 Tax=Putridiphycobacter roseus TaxID=2219161 RepID=A0A2W1NV41_9FLAO|nr:endonuclease [Putridiphycobacter roseus]PZE18648.1 endonuclease [Putridiphycobacter roseus]
MNRKTIYPILVLIISGIVYLLNQSKTEETAIKIPNKTKNMSTDPSIKKLSIAFYNVENLFDIYDDPNTFDEDFTPDGELRWDNTRYIDKLSKISDIITDIDSDNPPAVLGFAEVENYAVLKDLIHTGILANYPYEIIHQDNHDGRGIDVAAIYRSDVFKAKKMQYYPVILPGRTTSNTRDILHITGEFSNGEAVEIFFTHWSSRRKGTHETAPKRIATARIMREKIDLVLAKNPKANIIISGDFNDEPSDRSVKDYLVKKDFYNLSKKYENTKNGTVNHQGDWLVFDQIIVSNSLLNHSKIKVNKSDIHIQKTRDNTFVHRDGNEVPSRTYGGPKYYGGQSDHYPVYLNISITD